MGAHPLFTHPFWVNPDGEGVRWFGAEGRFLSADPVLDDSDPLQANGYSYANNNPVTHADPSGLTSSASSFDASIAALDAQIALQKKTLNRSLGDVILSTRWAVFKGFVGLDDVEGVRQPVDGRDSVDQRLLQGQEDVACLHGRDGRDGRGDGLGAAKCAVETGMKVAMAAKGRHGVQGLLRQEDCSRGAQPPSPSRRVMTS
ncbi:RHS repeat-associated core domain-containing protein [Streptomyces sp. NPDC051677]|uniref:RHS repeat-associated core domain-containing protein n=1 Tax=Streptomyces sp. NPDC051677 TaxID=3365669 RepID=UPI0037D55F8E